MTAPSCATSFTYKRAFCAIVFILVRFYCFFTFAIVLRFMNFYPDGENFLLCAVSTRGVKKVFIKFCFSFSFWFIVFFSAVYSLSPDLSLVCLKGSESGSVKLVLQIFFFCKLFNLFINSQKGDVNPGPIKWFFTVSLF